MSVDPDGFVEFAAARGPQLLRSAYLLAGDHHLAEDLVQTTLTNLYPGFGPAADTHRRPRAGAPR